MEIGLRVTEFRELGKSIQEKAEKLFKMMRQEIGETTGQYLSELIRLELTDFPGRLPYEGQSGIIEMGLIIAGSHSRGLARS